MSKTLTLEFPDEIFATIESVAESTGRSVEETAMEWKLRQRKPTRPQMSDEEREAAHQRFVQHFGSIDSGDPTSADNDKIDADLARPMALTDVPRHFRSLPHPGLARQSPSNYNTTL